VAPEGVRADEAGVLVQEELPRWWLRVVDWLEVLSDKHVRSVDNFHWADGSPALYTWSDEYTARSVPGKSWMRSSPRLTSAWRSMNYWPAAIQLAGLDQEPPLSCTLLMAAMRAFREGEYRTCVAHAGTAAEVALGEALRRIRNPPRDKDTLGTVAKNARASIHGLVPAVFKGRMIDVRNRVIHDGTAVDIARAADVFTLAQCVVHAVYPLLEVQRAGLILTPGNREPHGFGSTTQR
jgi:HEPN domain-containing protein